ncbi:MAG: PilZ domain-containing protein [Myxococcota bacterium]|nr:PilZ domain-containing protein [Myxococcota bacterium]
MHQCARKALQPGPMVNVVAKVKCGFQNDGVRDLYATRISLVDMFVLSLRPPPVGTVFSVVLCPLGMQPLPAIQAVVVSAKLDPRDASNCGFEAVFTSLTDVLLEKLHQTLVALEIPCSPPAPLPSPERRRDPRVHTRIEAHVDISGQHMSARVENLSMSGAFLRLKSKDIQALIQPGMIIDLNLLHESLPEYLSTQAEVVRRVTCEDGLGVGIRFVKMDGISSQRLEGLLLSVLSMEREVVS